MLECNTVFIHLKKSCVQASASVRRSSLWTSLDVELLCWFVVDLDRTVWRLRVLDVRFDTGTVDVVFVYWYWWTPLGSGRHRSLCLSVCLSVCLVDALRSVLKLLIRTTCCRILMSAIFAYLYLGCFGYLNKKLIRRWDSERELSLRRHCTPRTKNTVDSWHWNATDRFLQRRFTKFSEITQCNGHYAVQGHSRSPILVLIESSYTTSQFLLVINTNLPPILHRFQVMAYNNSASERGVLHLNALAGVTPC